MKQYFGSRVLFVLLGVVILVFIAVTLFMLLRHKPVTSIAPMFKNLPEISGLTPTSTLPFFSTGYTVEEENYGYKKQGMTESSEFLSDGSRHEIRSEVWGKRWIHASGTVVTLLYKDRYFLENFQNEYNQQILRVEKQDGATYELLNLNSENGGYIPSVSHVEFSPLGTYLVVEVEGYESSSTYFYDLRSGKEIEKKDKSGDPSFLGAKVYWSADEHKLLLLSNSDSMGGCGDCGTIMYSKTGTFDDVETAATSGEHDLAFNDAVLDGNVAYITVTERVNDPERRDIRTVVIFDFNTGKLRSGFSYLNK